MGPRPDGRGRAGDLLIGLTVAVLQWGRGRMAAEGSRSRRQIRVPLGFNGAAAGWPRKGDQASTAPGERIELQWGRGRMAAEGGDALECLRTLPRLQWGRGRMAAEGAIRTHT